MADIVHNTATATVAATGTPAQLRSVTLTPAAAVATVLVKTGGTSGTTVLALQAAANGNSAVWSSADNQGVTLDGIHVTLAGAGGTVDVEFCR